MSALEIRVEYNYAAYLVRCYRHRTGDELPLELRDTDIPPYECCDCVSVRDEQIAESLSFQERMDLGVGEFERFGETKT
jgi:hypothetical protein